MAFFGTLKHFGYSLFIILFIIWENNCTFYHFNFFCRNKKLQHIFLYFFVRYDRILIEKETKEKDWEVKENEHAQKGEEIEKLFEQIMSLEDKLQSQKELLNDSERQKTELQFEVGTCIFKCMSIELLRPWNFVNKTRVELAT